MQLKQTWFSGDLRKRYLRVLAFLFLIIGGFLTAIAVSYADVQDRQPPRGAVPNPGTQEQELANITFPAPYNVFEFVVTCAGCHGGSIDQQAGHFSNWAGTAMASAARDPIFRANQQIVNQTVLDLTGEDGAGNVCIRCHSPNAWYSGRTDPYLAGEADASNMVHSILLSTDGEGILCEFCHRVIGGVEMQRADLDPLDPAWNMLQGITDWPHLGDPYPDGPLAGNPFGDSALQINDGMAYGGKYPGYVDISFSDLPLAGTSYTGQTYGVYPPGWKDFLGNDVSGQTVVNPDGSVPIHLEVPVGPPIDGFDPLTGDPIYDYQGQSVSLEHPTFEGDFLKTSEFCGACHDLTIPVLNHGMPEQRTYTEWLYSEFGDGDGTGDVRCQDCHMPTMMHEYSDEAPVSVNPDPLLSGWFPYAKDRNDQGGTSFHKFGGSNRDLPMMMALLYPEVDLEVLGAPTGNDTRIFPGMLSDRTTMWIRAQRNTEIMLNDSVDLSVVGTPVEIEPGVYQVTVRVVNTTGHKIPSGYPDGRRMWLGVQAFNQADGSVVYESGYWNETDAYLYTDSSLAPFSRALTPIIDARLGNAVMVYEKITATCELDVDRNPVACGEPSPSLINNTIYFDNRIPPLGFSYDDYTVAGAKFISYDPVTGLPFEDVGRFADGVNYDEVTYIFTAPAGLSLDFAATAYWQTHTRPFMEHLRADNTSDYRPEGPPSIFAINYPLTPNYLSDQIPGFDTMLSLDGYPLQDNWGGIAYAAWLLTGKGAPYPVGSDNTAVSTAPAAPGNVAVVNLDPFSVNITWDPVPDADGYIVWIRYGVNEATASWDQLALVYDGTSLMNDAMNVAKTYGFKVQAFNGKGVSPDSVAVNITMPTDLPLAPENLQVAHVTADSVTLSWFDVADNEDGFIIQRQDVPVVGDFYTVAMIPSQTAGGGTGGNSWTDNGVLPGMTYNYRVAAFNAEGNSTWTVPVAASTLGVPGAPTITDIASPNGFEVNLTWLPGTGTAVGYRLERSTSGPTGPWTTTFSIPSAVITSYTDLTVMANTTYWYRIFAYNFAGDSPPSNVVTVSTSTAPPAPPSGLAATAVLDPAGAAGVRIDLVWTDNATNEEGFYIERADGAGPDYIWTVVGTVGPNTTTFTDLTGEQKWTYSYRVQAFRSGGASVSDYSNIAMVVTPAEIPEAPSELVILREGVFRIRIGWRDNSANEVGFFVERSLDGVNFVRVATVPANTVLFTDSGLDRLTTYWYRVQAYNLNGESAYSETVMGTTR